MTRKQDRKARVQELAGDLAKSPNFEALAIREMLQLLLEDAKDLFVDALPADFNRLQGEVQTLRKLHTLVTRAPATPKE